MIDDRDFSTKCRDFTVSCCRFDYFGPIIEAQSVDQILHQASRSEYRYCLVQACGHVMIRYSDVRRSIDTNFVGALRQWVGGRDFLVAGRIVDGQECWYGLDDLCILVDLETYRSFGRPEFQRACPGPARLPACTGTGEETSGGPVIRALRPTAGEIIAEPRLPGWSLIAASLSHGKAVCDFDPILRRCRYDLRARGPADIETFRRYRGEGIFAYDEQADDRHLSDDWRGFLEFVKDQAKHAKQGVFLGNWEGYDDVAEAPRRFRAPISSLYGVAAGFKPNHILETHGFDDRTRIVFFDYSTVALDLRRALVEEWNGVDYPGFIESIAGRFPDAFYQLWGNLWDHATPGALNLEIVAAIWENELRTWGGELAFQRHWSKYRVLSHRFVRCDLFADPRPLLDAVEPEPNAIMWWSNAFHSLNGVWFYDMEERQRIYRRWIRALADINPDFFLYGADVDNLDIGGTCLRDHLPRA